MSAEPHTHVRLPNGEEDSFAKEQEMEALRLEVESLRRQIEREATPIRLLWAWEKVESALREYADAVVSATPRELERYRIILQLERHADS